MRKKVVLFFFLCLLCSSFLIAFKTNIQRKLSAEVQDLYLNSSSPSYELVPRKTVYFAMNHEQLFSPWDTGFEGYSDFNCLLQEYGLEVSSITTNLSLYTANMTSEDILFLNEAKNAAYSPEEVSAILGFVEGGGNVMVIGEHAMLNFSEFQNSILNHFGMNLTYLDLEDEHQNVANRKLWCVFNSTFFNLTNLSIMYGAVIHLSGEAFAIANASHTANYPHAPIMAGYENTAGGPGQEAFIPTIGQRWQTDPLPSRFLPTTRWAILPANR